MAPSTRTIFMAVLIISFISISETAIYGKFIQIGDIHYDPTYEDTGDSCNREIPREERKPYGNYECDAPWRLIEHTVKEVNRNNYKTDFIMWAGDVSSHVRNASMLDDEKVLDVLNTTSHLLRDGICPEIPMFPLMGNHDYFPKSQLPATGGLYPRIADIFCPIFNLDQDPDGCDTFRKAGYYSWLLDNKLLLLMLNTNLYSPSNRQVEETDKDPAGQFTWMREKFIMARKEGHRVQVFPHIPPGMQETMENRKMYKDTFNKEFNKIIREFSDVITGVYSAHLHTDSFRIYYKDGEPVVPVLISPSVTPWQWGGGGGQLIPRNPALRIIKFQHEGLMHLTDYDQFYLKLNKANDAPVGFTVTWEKEYHFTSYIAADNATARALHAVSEDFTKFVSKEFHKYFERNSVMIHENKDKPPGLNYFCDKRCKQRHICTIKNVDYDDYRECLVEVRSVAMSVNKPATFFVSFFVIISCNNSYLTLSF